MGIFEEKIRQRTRLDNEMVLESVRELANTATGQKESEAFGDESLRLHAVISSLSRYLNVTVPYTAGAALSVEWVQEQVFRPNGIMWREVALKGSWYENADGVMLGAFSDGKPVLFLPSGNGRYFFRDPKTGRKTRISRENAGLFSPAATLYYRSLPSGKLDRGDIVFFIRQCVSKRELFGLVFATLCILLLGMVTPAMTKILLTYVTAAGEMRLLLLILCVLVLITAAIFFITCIRQLILARIGTKVALPLQAAFMMRILTAQASDLKTFAAGDLGSRIGTMYIKLKRLMVTFLSIFLTAACSLICFFQMFRFAPAPAAAAAGIAAALILLLVCVIRTQADVSLERMVDQAEESGLTYSMIDGMQKISLAGAEQRAFAKWANVYRKAVKTFYDPPLLLKVYKTLVPVILLAGTVVLYLIAAKKGVSEADFFAFSSSYAILTGALTLAANNADDFADSLSTLRVLEPVMAFESETNAKKEVVQKLRGNISLRNVTFGYTKSMPPVLDGLNLEIHSGEYAAIVGATGCGKSTIFRLILGFEKPDHGEVLFDGKNLDSLDVTSLRRKIGTVLQEGDIFAGTIFSNITVSAPHASADDAWAAAETAGIADDIRSLPMQMNTFLPDGGRGVSGGQKQRLLIARAVVSKPSILLFDEATSALDNITQKAVADALGELNCTRVVIAHRLSTVQNCDRILFLEDGRIAEEGTYQELIRKKGRFAELVRRQQIQK